MNRQEKLNNPIKSLHLENDVDVVFYDLSKAVAGDRWLIKICCVVELPMAEKFIEKLEEDREIARALKESCDGKLSMEIIKQRNFVDENTKGDVLNQLIDQVELNSLEYVSNDIFPWKFFLSKVEEFKKNNMTSQVSRVDDEPDEDDGPSDFSACFKD